MLNVATLISFPQFSAQKQTIPQSTPTRDSDAAESCETLVNIHSVCVCVYLSDGETSESRYLNATPLNLNLCVCVCSLSPFSPDPDAYQRHGAEGEL